MAPTAGRHLALVGPTASGKSAVALELARRHAPHIEICSVDSMQVYRGMDIGTAKPTTGERHEVPHHMIDLVEPDQEFSVAEFQRSFREVLTGIEERGRSALLVGGTGLYHRAVVDDLDLPGRYPEIRASLADRDTRSLHEELVVLDPVAAARIEPGNRRRLLRALEVTLGGGRAFSSYGPGLDAYPRVPYSTVGIWLPRPELRRRIDARYQAQMRDGFLDEVRELRRNHPAWSRTASQALGYRELAAHLDGHLTLDEALEQARRRTRRFARRQIKWFERDPRVEWVAPLGDPEVLIDDLDRYWVHRVLQQTRSL